MKYVAIFFFSLLMFISVSCAGDKPELEWRTFNRGLTEARSTHKKIMLDVYTDWCKWCKKLDSEVYSEDKVAAYLKKEFVVIKLNAESDQQLTYKGKRSSEMQLAHAFGVEGYPTIIFLDPNGDNITSIPGFVPAEKFLPILHYIGEDHYKSMSWEDYQNSSTRKD